MDKTLARLSYISDGLDVSKSEFEVWRNKLERKQLLMTNPAKSGPTGNVATLLLFARAVVPSMLL